MKEFSTQINLYLCIHVFLYSCNIKVICVIRGFIFHMRNLHIAYTRLCSPTSTLDFTRVNSRAFEALARRGAWRRAVVRRGLLVVRGGHLVVRLGSLVVREITPQTAFPAQK